MGELTGFAHPLSCLDVSFLLISNDYCTLLYPGHGLEVTNVPLTISTCFIFFAV